MNIFFKEENMKKLKVLGLIFLSSAAMPVLANMCVEAGLFVLDLTGSVYLAYQTLFWCEVLMY